MAVMLGNALLFVNRKYVNNSIFGLAYAYNRIISIFEDYYLLDPVSARLVQLPKSLRV